MSESRAMHATPLTSDDTLTVSERLRIRVERAQEQCDQLIAIHGETHRAAVEFGYYVTGMREALLMIERYA